MRILCEHCYLDIKIIVYPYS